MESADRLFYREGIRAVGIDRIIAEAEVAKMSLYNHFKSKDDLVLAVLRYRDQKINQYFATAIQRQVDVGSNRLDAFFSALKDWFQSKGFRGCAFINAVVELADPKHPAAAFSARHKELFREMLAEIVKETHGAKAAAMIPAIAMIIEGAIVTAVMDSKPDAADVAREAVLSLLRLASSRNK